MKKELSNNINQNKLKGILTVRNEMAIRGITLVAFAISRKCVRYEERAWKPCERREKERKV